MLFEPLEIKGLKLKNRIVMAPMATNFGLRSERAITYYTERAKGGVGLVIAQGTPISIFQSQSFLAGVAKLVDAIHAAGAKAAIQLWWGNELPSGEAVAPSATGNMREITREEIADTVQRYAFAAGKAKEAGFDAVNIHGAHQYFLHQFFSPRTNQRTDEYGGSLDRRMRFAVDIVAATRAAVGDDYPIMYRHSAREYFANGITIEHTKEFAVALEKAGVDIIDVSVGRGPGKIDLISPRKNQPLATHADLAAAVKGVVKKARVVAVGRMNTGEVTERVLQEGKADLIAVGRQLIADPYWARKVREGCEAEIVVCTACNKCNKTFEKQIALACEVNPLVGREWEVANGTLTPEDIATLMAPKKKR
ncbi:MAG: NADH:flavin oxidoreductase [Dehalococcoidia bacterium]|nr:NADH:flavin oxidoreductase [Dehalococcoidia bacterium]